MKVAVLGAGPAGLLAAWAVIDTGHEPVVLEKNPHKPDGKTAGVYFLDDKCNLPIRRREVEILTSGGQDVVERQRSYERKVYGDLHRETKPYHVGPTRQVGYDGMQALGLCWDIVHPFIRRQEVADWNEVMRCCEEYEVVVNTIPLDVLLPDREWRHQRALIYRATAPDEESYVLYNSNPCVSWYRASAVFGVFTLEYPHGVRLEDVKKEGSTGTYVRVKKVVDSPLAMPVDLPDNLLLTGRFGAWAPRKNSHHAYYDVVKRFDRW